MRPLQKPNSVFKIFIPLLALWCVISSLSLATKKHKDSPDLSKIDAFINETVDRFKIPGLAVAITRNDSVIYQKALGVKNIQSQEKITTKSVFHWASVSKTFVAAAIMQLAEQGKLRLEEKVITYLPYFKLNSKWYRDITIKQLLNHTAGIKDWEDIESEKPQNDDQALERYVRSLSSDNMDFKNGKSFNYSNTGFDLLGNVIAKVSGMTFEEYMKKNIFEPLGMNSTTFYYPEVPAGIRVSPHCWKSEVSVFKSYPYNRIHAPSSTLNSTIEDMTRWSMVNIGRGQLNSKTILSKQSFDQLWTGTVKPEEKLEVGLCWFLVTGPGYRIVCHSGTDPGFQSFLLLCPEKNISVIVVSNYEGTPAEDIGGSLFSLMLNEAPERIKQNLFIPYAEVLKKEGKDAANKFFNRVKADTTTYVNSEYDWAESSYLLFKQDSTLKDLSIALFRKNIEIYPESSDAYYHFAIGWDAIRHKDSAIFYVDKALKMNPKDKDAADFRKSLKK